MKVQNVEPRLIYVGGVFIAPSAIEEVDDKADGLAGLLERGVLVEIKAEGKKSKEAA